MANDILGYLTSIDDLKCGTSDVDKVYLGTTLVWQSLVLTTTPVITFENYYVS